MDARLFACALRVYARAHGVEVSDLERDASAASDMGDVLAIARIIEEELL